MASPAESLTGPIYLSGKISESTKLLKNAKTLTITPGAFSLLFDGGPSEIPVHTHTKKKHWVTPPAHLSSMNTVSNDKLDMVPTIFL